MAKIKLEIEAEPAQIDALRVYLGRKHSSLEHEIERHVESLYSKHVPNIVRDFISANTQIKNNGRKVEGSFGP